MRNRTPGEPLSRRLSRGLPTAAILLGTASAVQAVPYTLPTSTERPFAQLQPATGGATLCATWIDEGACDVAPGTFRLVTYTLGWIGRSEPVTVAPSSGSAVPAPADLRADVYSDVAAELFWTREAAALALRYEIRLDGAEIATTNGVSFLTEALGTGRDYTFEVTAIGRDGERSDPATITVRTDGDPNGGPGPDEPELDAPTGLRGERYSFRAGEVFWDRVAGARLSYEVSIDDEVVGTSAGTSAFIDNRADLDTATIEVVAIDASGRRSSPASVTLGATEPEPDPDPETPLTPIDPPADSPFLPTTMTEPLLADIEAGSPLSLANHPTFLSAFYRIAGQELIERVRREMDAVSAAVRSAQNGESSEFVAESVSGDSGGTFTETVFLCPEGGRVTATLSTAPRDYAGIYQPLDQPSTDRLDYDECAVEGTILDGPVREYFRGAPDASGSYRGYARLYGSGDVSAATDEGDPDDIAFVLESAGGDRLALSLRQSGTNAPVSRNRTFGHWALRSGERDLAVEIEDVYLYDERVSDSPGFALLDAIFTMSGTVTNERSVEAIDLRQLSGDSSLRYLTFGEQAFNDGQGGSLFLEADTADRGLFRLRGSAEGQVFDRTVSQDEGVRFLRYDPR